MYLKRFFVFFIFLKISVLNVWGQYNLTQERYADGALKAQGRYTAQHERDSLWTFFYPDGKTSALLPYKNGMLHGKAQFYDFTGKLQAIEFWQNDIQQDSAWYYENGVLHKCGKLKDGVYDGQWHFYNAQKQLVRQGNYVKGLPDGQWTFWDDNGTLWQKGQFREGKERGWWQFFSEKGLLQHEGNYEDGKAVGKWKYYNKKGKFWKEDLPPQKP